MTPALVSEPIKWFGAIISRAHQFADTHTDPQADAVWRTLICNFDSAVDDPEREDNGRPQPGFRAYFDLQVRYVQTINDADIYVENMAADEFEDCYPVPAGAIKYWIIAMVSLSTRRVVRTQAGRFGLVPATCEGKDVIAVFHGVPVPFVLRSDQDNEGYQVVGISYIHGLMNGEAFDQGLLVRSILLR